MHQLRLRYNVLRFENGLSAIKMIKDQIQAGLRACLTFAVRSIDGSSAYQVFSPSMQIMVFHKGGRF